MSDYAAPFSNAAADTVIIPGKTVWDGLGDTYAELFIDGWLGARPVKSETAGIISWVIERGDISAILEAIEARRVEMVRLNKLSPGYRIAAGLRNNAIAAAFFTALGL